MAFSSTSPILLCTLNARYTHASFGLRYLYANLKDLQAQAKIIEFTIGQNPKDIAEAILAHRPQVVGFGVYIWNALQTRDVVSILKRVQPELKVVLGGPEVSFETDQQDICRLADLTVQGEGEDLFYNLCKNYLADGTWPPATTRAISGPLPEVKSLVLPYSYYTDEDVRNRVIYVEASRGCPYKCEYCLSSLDKSVRSFDLDRFLEEMSTLIERGVRQFKFVDRTFNLSIATSSRILNFFLERIELGLFLHFEMVPDRLPPELRELVRKFPDGSLQFEIGIQTWNPEVSKLVSRRQDYGKIVENFAFLGESGNVHIHADLIAGLPGETWESFAHGFDQVTSLGPSEVQVGILKRLRGTPIIRHDTEWKMVYQDQPPYQVLSTRTLSFESLQKISRFSQFWDLIANSGNFTRTMAILRDVTDRKPQGSLFSEFEKLSEFLHGRHRQSNGIALLNLLESVWLYFKDILAVDPETLRAAMIEDYSSKVKRDVPRFLQADSRIDSRTNTAHRRERPSALPERQQRHWS